ncbi:hypothetical protein [Botrimarina sp.]|uniref:hypothetical protein n=1 Tax=Botrimarina sp. TaxID=2795802 RepID=UPI0032EFA3DD
MIAEPDLTPSPDDSFDRLDELLSLFFDDQLSGPEVEELNRLLTDDADARTRSVEMMQLHADLYAHFRRKGPDAADPKKAIVDLGLTLDSGVMSLQ